MCCQAHVETGQCMYSIILWHVQEPLLPWKQQYVRSLLVASIDVVNNINVFSAAMETTMDSSCTVIDLQSIAYSNSMKYYGVCLFTCLNYQVCKLHLFCAELYCYLLPVWLYHMFPHYIINDTIFQKNLLNIKLCFDFCYNISYSRKNSGRYHIFS